MLRTRRPCSGTAALKSEFLKSIVPWVTCHDYFSGLIFPGGAKQLNVAITWDMCTRIGTAQSIDFHNWTKLFRTLSLTELAENVGDEVPFWRDWINHTVNDEYWWPLKLIDRFHEITVPVYPGPRLWCGVDAGPERHRTAVVRLLAEGNSQRRR